MRVQPPPSLVMSQYACQFEPPELRVYIPLGKVRGIALHDANTQAPAVSQPFDALPSQFEKPVLQVPSEQVPPLQVPDALAKVHARPHDPQLAALFEKFASQPSTTLPLQLPKPLVQVIPQALLAQVLVELGRAGHVAPQAPQWVTLDVVFVSQPLVALLSQLPKPAPQVKPQVPEPQVVVALARAGHALPQRPQFAV